MKINRFFLLCCILFTCSTVSAQQTRKVKFRDQNGNVIYYLAVPNSDDVRYCDLYFIPKNTNSFKKIIVKKYTIEDSEIGETCDPSVITINNFDYQIKIHNYGDYIILKNNDGKIIRFNPIN